jgi:hypothetical protein
MFHPQMKGSFCMPIPNAEEKKRQIIGVICDENTNDAIAEKYGNGPSLYFYQKVLRLRANANTVQDFMAYEANMEAMYALLALWGMDTRAARMIEFIEFTHVLSQARDALAAFEAATAEQGDFSDLLRDAYSRLHVMTGASRLVSNAKLLHFLFPKVLMPMDGQNTLMYLYGSTYESCNRYLEIVAFSREVEVLLRGDVPNVTHLLDDKWSPNVPKLIDNAIILLRAVQLE